MRLKWLLKKPKKPPKRQKLRNFLPSPRLPSNRLDAAGPSLANKEAPAVSFSAGAEESKKQDILKLQRTGEEVGS